MAARSPISWARTSEQRPRRVPTTAAAATLVPAPRAGEASSPGTPSRAPTSTPTRRLVTTFRSTGTPRSGCTRASTPPKAALHPPPLLLLPPVLVLVLVLVTLEARRRVINSVSVCRPAHRRRGWCLGDTGHT